MDGPILDGDLKTNLGREKIALSDKEKKGSWK